MFKNVLVPIDTDESDVAVPGVQFAAQLAALTNGAVRMIHVLPPAPWRVQEILPAQLQVDREGVALKKMKEMAKKANVPTDNFSATVRSGSVYDEVLAEAETWGADLIIIGSHSPSMSTYLLGSNAQNIVRHANCSVLVIRAHKDESGNYWLFPQFGS